MSEALFLFVSLTSGRTEAAFAAAGSIAFKLFVAHFFKHGFVRKGTSTWAILSPGLII